MPNGAETAVAPALGEACTDRYGPAADRRAVGHLYHQVLPHEAGCEIPAGR